MRDRDGRTCIGAVQSRPMRHVEAPQMRATNAMQRLARLWRVLTVTALLPALCACQTPPPATAAPVVQTIVLNGAEISYDALVACLPAGAERVRVSRSGQFWYIENPREGAVGPRMRGDVRAAGRTYIGAKADELLLGG